MTSLITRLFFFVSLHTWTLVRFVRLVVCNLKIIEHHISRIYFTNDDPNKKFTLFVCFFTISTTRDTFSTFVYLSLNSVLNHHFLYTRDKIIHKSHLTSQKPNYYLRFFIFVRKMFWSNPIGTINVPLALQNRRTVGPIASFSTLMYAIVGPETQNWLFVPTFISFWSKCHFGAVDPLWLQWKDSNRIWCHFRPTVSSYSCLMVMWTSQQLIQH